MPQWLVAKVTGHEAMCQGLRETACKYVGGKIAAYFQ